MSLTPGIDPPEIEELVICKIKARRAKGRKKYGTTMNRQDLHVLDWLKHAQEEALDLAIYLERLMRDLQPKPKGMPRPD